jgi:hypothetical protein
MGVDESYTDDHASFLKRCNDAGQTRPTPLPLHYVPGDFNCLHQGLYGDLAFPIRVAILLSQPGVDFTGGEFVLTEQRPRMQSGVEVVPFCQGDAVPFAVHNRPVHGSRGNYRVNLRLGVSRVRSGGSPPESSSTTRLNGRCLDRGAPPILSRDAPRYIAKESGPIVTPPLSHRLEPSPVDIRASILTLRYSCEPGFHELLAKPIISTETHYYRPPEIGIDPIWFAHH